MMGSTASGKTALAEALADRTGAQLVNADAFQAYRYMDIGTAKPDEPDRYKLLDLKDPSEQITVGEWVALARAVLVGLWAEQRSAIVVGGTGMYIRALFEEYAEMSGPATPERRAFWQSKLDEEGLESLVAELRSRGSAEGVDLNNPLRVTRALERSELPAPTKQIPLPAFRRIKVGLQPDYGRLRTQIALRTEKMSKAGWPEEVGALLERGFKVSDPGFKAHGYRAMADVFLGYISMSEAVLKTTVEVQQYAKRQRTWMRKEPSLVGLPDLATRDLEVAVANML